MERAGLEGRGFWERGRGEEKVLWIGGRTEGSGHRREGGRRGVGQVMGREDGEGNGRREGRS